MRYLQLLVIKAAQRLGGRRYKFVTARWTRVDRRRPDSRSSKRTLKRLKLDQRGQQRRHLFMFASCSIKTTRRPRKIDSAAEIAVWLGGRAEAEEDGSVARVHERATSKQGEELMVSMPAKQMREGRYREMKSTLLGRVRPRRSAWRAPPHRSTRRARNKVASMT